MYIEGNARLPLARHTWNLDITKTRKLWIKEKKILFFYTCSFGVLIPLNIYQLVCPLTFSSYVNCLLDTIPVAVQKYTLYLRAINYDVICTMYLYFGIAFNVRIYSPYCYKILGSMCLDTSLCEIYSGSVGQTRWCFSFWKCALLLDKEARDELSIAC